jgi:cysteine/O-acetylserine efflux protein
MPENLLPALLLQIFVVGYTPGPANIYSLTMAVRFGRAKSMRMWAGLFTGATIAVLIMAVLTHFIGEALGSYVIYLKYLGAAYIVYLAYKMWKNGTTGEKDDRGCSFLNGMIVQLTNAKILLFELSVYSTFVLPYSSRIHDLLPVAALLLIAGPGANLVWILIGSSLSHIVEKYHKQVSIISAIALVFCAVYIVLS